AKAQSNLIGFKKQNQENQLKNEKKFDSYLDAARIGLAIKELSAVPHHVGSPGGRIVAEKIKEHFTEYGWDAKIETYYVLFPTPITRVLEMTAPTKFIAKLKEPALKEDQTSGQDGQLPTYNCWSADGDVTAGLVFVNYGLPEDYSTLEKYGVSVKGKIVIAKYGRSWRGIKPKVAQEHGAIGCLIYSDPADDGYVQGDVYPKGPFKNEYGVQRGSIMDMVIYPGDPSTPNSASTQNAARIDHNDAINLLKIPVLPISYSDAKPLLEALSGNVVPRNWAGGLPITYHFGDGSTIVHLKVNFDWKIREANNVIATIVGSEYPDQWIIRGNHHDAWVNGADDPISSMAAELDEAYAIGQLIKQGWKPKRTLKYCAWDAEEPGLMGSTEWVEDHAAELQQKAVLYINTDGNGRGFVNVDGSHALENLITQICMQVKDPQTNVSVFERDQMRQLAESKGLEEAKKITNKKNYAIDAMGSGSDYSPFIQHLGIPALNIGFGGENAGGEYHSIYDSYDNYVRFKDINFMYGPVLASVVGRVVLRTSEADLLPFNYKNTTSIIKTYIQEVIQEAQKAQQTILLTNLKSNENAQNIAADPKLNLSFNNQEKPAAPFLNFAPLQNAFQNLEQEVQNISLKVDSLSPMKINELNKKFAQAEQQLLAPDGLPKRSWYKHTLYAPGFYTGYGVKTLPGIREAIEQGNWSEAQEQIQQVANALNKLKDFLAK
ncbi:MAG: M28 family peptidase, partial [Sediminibacterium sp.]|nr:M28 family peptidase [Sediminibacterium sp.]